MDRSADCTGSEGRHRILILGGGFAGIYAAQRLERTLARNPKVEITLVNRDNYLLFTPMLHEVAGGELEATALLAPSARCSAVSGSFVARCS
jgi:NADH dehydrogenase FAD-containing subunit